MDGVDAGVWARNALARVLAARGPGGEAEAEALARRALAVHLALGTGGERAAAEIEAWSAGLSQGTG